MANSFDLYDFVLASPRETDLFGHTIGKVLRRGDVLALVGELGAGKTALVRGVVTGLGGPVASVTSPTFTLAHEYQGRLPLIHLDLYRLKRVDEAESIGLSECFTEEVVAAIEWADRFPDFLPADHLEVRLIHRTRTTRMVQLNAQGAQSRSLLMRIHRAWHATDLSGRSPRSRTKHRRKASQR
ncbi:MAG: tRNA (adenosine(37)-N6)-threonylcarbamoyltransferase complex ATPase subunit type 1 TsaE [Nitrospira sp.]|nr:tRNA (adenosine(37)-N6)-threonylcarbamoyltransferase complex ATPase subunit type 1 TsaE [Nitrospira sp.]